MSKCLNWFPIVVLGEPNYTIIWLNLQGSGKVVEVSLFL